MGNLSTNAQHIVDVQISSFTGNFEKLIVCSVLENIVNLLPDTEFSIDTWKIPTHVLLADPEFNVPGKIDMLLGAPVFWDVLGCRKIFLVSNHPFLWETELGWIVSGEIQKTE